MKKWDAVKKRDLGYLLRNELKRPAKGIVLNEQIAYAPDEDIERPSYGKATGWHFYSHLIVAPSLLKAEDNTSSRRLVQLYRDYTQAARNAISSQAVDNVFLLEHQGVLLHFFLACDQNEFQGVIDFAKSLASAVSKHVFADKKEDVETFKMAAEYGASVIIKMPSASGEESAHSRISIGPCANDPAKKLLGDTPPDPWHFAYRDEDAGRWQDVDFSACRLLPADDSLVTEVLLSNRAFASSIQVIDDESCAPQVYHGFVFRADLDGFSNRIKELFEDDDELAMQELAQKFIDFMSDVNDWEENFIPENKVIVLPWAGDCCNMFAYPIDGSGRNDKQKVKENLSDFPTKMIESWCTYLAEKKRNHEFSNWTYGMASGCVRIFPVKVESTPYRLMVGWPVGVSQEGVNLDGTKPDYLIMHEDDINEMEDYAQKSFTVFKPSSHYYKQDGAARKNAIVAAAAKQAGQTHVGNFFIPPTRPYYSTTERNLFGWL